MKKLYQVTFDHADDCYVMAESFAEAEEKIIKALEKAFYRDTNILSITMVAFEKDDKYSIQYRLIL